MDQQFSLSWNNFHGNLSKGFAGLLGKGEFVDVTIAVDGHLLHAHKVILSICSPYFKKMFQTNPCQHPIVVLRDVTHKAMRDLLQFMYHGEVSVKQEDLTSFIGTAEVLQIKGLTNKETDDEETSEIKSQVTKENSIKVHNNVTNDTELDDESEIAEESQTRELDLSKQNQFIDKIQRLNNLKRKSEEYLQKTYYATDIFDKRQKFKEKMITKHNSTYQNNFNIYNESPVNIISTFNQAVRNDENIKIKHDDKNHHDQMLSPESNLQLKSECDDVDIVVTDPAVCNSPKSYDTSNDNQKDSLNYSTAQDNCSSLSSLFLDLRNLVNGKICHDGSRVVNQSEVQRDTKDHRLITIPQKEDGKKKYPQRSCRLCWRLGKRRDTRFMCSACELPFCKSPCFEIHYENVIKAARLHGDFYTP